MLQHQVQRDHVKRSLFPGARQGEKIVDDIEAASACVFRCHPRRLKTQHVPAMVTARLDEIAGASGRFLRALETNAPSRNREEEAAKLKARAAERFGA